MTTRGIVFYQQICGADTNKYVIGKTIVWADQLGCGMNIALNFEEEIADRLDIKIDAEQVIADWLNRIELPGKKLYFIPSESVIAVNQDRISNFVCLPAPEILHEHFDLITSGGYTTQRDADFIGQPIRGLMEKCGSSTEDAYKMMTIDSDDYELDKTAIKLAQLFRLEESLFDPYTDQEALIRIGAFSDVRMLHALRSLSWIVSRYAKQEHCLLTDISFADLQKMGDLIEKRNYLNYNGETGFVHLCNHYDWHVFYVPDAYMNVGTAMHTDLRCLTGKENRGGNTMSVFIPGMDIDSLRAMHRKSDIISRNEETMESLENFRKDLEELLPIMQTIYDGFIKDRDRSVKLEGPLADALTAWCALAIAAKEPFYSEEAADTPEANAGLDGPMERLTDAFDTSPAARKPGTKPNASAKTTALSMPKGDLLDLGGETVIKPSQFMANMNLQNIIIPEGVTEIGDHAFQFCTALETVVLPKTLKKIGKMAFMSCRMLRQVEIPEGVEEICDFAFGATNNLKEVYLPDSLQRVDRYIFGLGGDSPYATAYMSGELASRLQANSKNPQFLSAINARRYVIDSVGYNNMYDYGKSDSSPSEFSGNVDEKSFDEYRDEMEEACKEGKPLQDMIEASRKAVNADEYGDKDAFEQAIKNLDRNAAVSFSGKHFVLTGFGGYEGNVIAEIEKRGGKVHSSMVKSADYLVVCLESPGAAKVNKALEWRQKGASNLIVSDYQMWQAVFGKTSSVPSDTKKSKATKPAGSTSDTVKKSQPAVQTSTEPAKNSKPKAETGPKPASNGIAKKKETKTVHRDYIIENGSIKGKNKKLTKIVIPEGVISIADSAFEHFEELTEVFIPDSVKYIGNSAFNACMKLSKINIPDGIVSIGKKAFSACHSLTSVIIPNTITAIEDETFSAAGLTSIIIPDSVITIGKFAFWHSKLTSVTIPDSVTSIGERAFDFCRSLTSVNIPDSVVNIGNCALDSSLLSVTVSEKHPAFVSIEGVLFSKKDKRLIFYPASKTDKEYAIPEGTEIIGSASFADASFTSVTIPNSVKTIEDLAFCGSSLTSVTIPSSVTTIEDLAFSGCEKLTSAAIPSSVTTISESMFKYCSSLTCVNIPDSVTMIMDGAFKGCTSLTSVIIPDSVTSIGYGAFYECSGLPSITIPNSVTALDNFAFSKCSGLTSVSISKSITAINYETFSNCTSLSSVTIPDSVTSIGTLAFSGCSALSTVTIPDSVTNIADDSFPKHPNLTFNVFENSYAAQYCRDRNLRCVFISRPSAVNAQDKNMSGAASSGEKKRKYGWIGDIIPDGANQAEIEEGLEKMSDADAQATIDMMKQLENLQGEVADLSSMIDQTQKEKEEQAEKERLKAQAERKAAEARKQEHRNRIKDEIQRLTDEMNSLRGLFAGIKRRKLQKQIDALNEQLRSI